MIVRLPIRIVDRELLEMGVEQDGEKVELGFRIDLVESAYPSTDKQTKEKTTHMTMASGDAFDIYMPYEDFWKIWADYIEE